MKKRIISPSLVLALILCGCGAKKPAQENADSAELLTEVKTTQYFTDEKVVEEDVQKILSAGVNAPSAMNTQPWHFTAVIDDEVINKLKEAMSSIKPPARDDGETSEMPEGAPEKTEGIPEKPDGTHERPDGTHERPEGAPEMPKDAQGRPPMSDGDKADFLKASNKAGIGDAPLTIVISCEEGSELSAGLALQNMSAEAQLLGYGTKILTSPTMALNGENKEEYKELLGIPENQKIVAVLLVGKAASAEENADAASSATTRNSFDEMVTIIGK